MKRHYCGHTCKVEGRGANGQTFVFPDCREQPKWTRKIQRLLATDGKAYKDFIKACAKGAPDVTD